MKMQNRLVALSLACAACVKGVDAAVDQDRALAAGCASCHQPAQRAPPPLAGQPRAELAAKMREFRNGTRSGTVMPQLAKGYTEAQIDAIARYLAARPPFR